MPSLCMKSTVSHLVYFIQNFTKNLQLYRELFAYFEYKVCLDEEGAFGVVDANGFYIYFNPTQKNTANSYDSTGLNHLAFEVDLPKHVDQFIREFMKPGNIQPLFDTPRQRPEFADAGEGYYQVMFEMPGELLFEVVSYTKNS